MKNWIAGALAMAAFAANLANAEMVYTGGVLSSLGEQTTITGAGSFAVDGVQSAVVYINPVETAEREVAWGDAEVLLNPYSISLTGGAQGSRDFFGTRFSGSVSGTIEFDVLTAQTMQLDWAFTGDFLEAQASIYGANGLLIGCVGDLGCAESPAPGSPSQLALMFTPGHYELRFSSASEFGTGDAPIANTFSLNLTPVPLPAAAWLLLSGLGGLGLLRRRRVL